MGSDVKIARALISVTDKTGVVDFARTLVDDFGVEIISTGGTARAIEDAGVPVTPIEEFTGYPEMMDGRVKTLHPKVHGALLARRDSEQHMQEAAQHGIKLIDLVVVNLYEFEKTVANPRGHLCGCHRAHRHRRSLHAALCRQERRERYRYLRPG